MGYDYTDPKRASEPTALPDVEVFEVEAGELGARCDACGERVELHAGCCERTAEPCEAGYYFAFGFPGCLWDGEPEGPFDSEAEALDAARELAGVYDDES